MPESLLNSSAGVFSGSCSPLPRGSFIQSGGSRSGPDGDASRCDSIRDSERGDDAHDHDLSPVVRLLHHKKWLFLNFESIRWIQAFNLGCILGVDNPALDLECRGQFIGFLRPLGIEQLELSYLFDPCIAPHVSGDFVFKEF